MLSTAKLLLLDNLRIAKYLGVSIGVYIYIMSAIFILVDYFSFDKVFAYVLIYITAYILEYALTLRVVFNAEHELLMIIKFACYVLGFLIVSTYLYKFLIFVGVHYLLAVLSVAVFLMPLRFVVNKFWVYC